VYLAGGILALAAVVVAIASAVAPASSAPSATVIAVIGPSAQPVASAAPGDVPGVVRDGGVVVDQPDPTPFGTSSATAPARSVPRPLARGPLNDLELGRWLLLWPFLVAISLAATTLWIRRSAAAERRAPR
jgi:hypothetical protein